MADEITKEDQLQKIAQEFNNLNLSYFGITAEYAQKIYSPVSDTTDEAISEITKIHEENKKTKKYTLPRYYSDSENLLNVVSPFSITANNIENKTLILLQDWSSHNILSKPESRNEESFITGFTKSLKTNTILAKLISEHLYKIKTPENISDVLSTVYISNIFPFIKPGDISASIPVQDIKNLGLPILEKIITILEPNLIICLGNHSFRNLSNHYRPRKALDTDWDKLLVNKHQNHFEASIGTTKTLVWAQRHPSRYRLTDNDLWKNMVANSIKTETNH
jgi:uracil-DNA glycosylase